MVFGLSAAALSSLSAAQGNAMQIPSFSGFRRSLKKTRVPQHKYIDSKYIRDSLCIRESIERHLKYLSDQIFFVDEEINIALLKDKYLPRKPNQWVKEARTLKCQASDLIKEQQNSKNPSFKSEELKHVSQKIFDQLKHCPVEDMYDKPITFIASMHEIEDKKLSHANLKTEQILKPLQRDVLQDQDVEMILASVGTSVPAVGLMERDNTVADGNQSGTVEFPDSYPASISEIRSERMPTSESMWAGETVEGASSQVHDAMIPEISPEDSNPPYISEIQIENRYESEITEEGTDPEDMVAKISGLPIQQETGLHRRYKTMPISVSDPNSESASCSEAEVEPEMRVLTSEKISPELQIEMRCSSQAQESKHLGESSARPTQTDDFRLNHENAPDLGMIITISVIGEMSKSVDLKLEILSTSSSQETINLNNYFGLDPQRDSYLFSVMKKPIQLELDGQITLMGGQQSSGPPETSQTTGALLPEYLVVNRSGCRLTEMPTADEWRQAGVVNLVAKNFLLLPKESDCPNLVLFFLQRNNCLTCIPPSFFDHMPALRFLDLSNTRIRALPSSLFTLTNLQVLMVRSCVCLDSLPPEVKNFRNMEVLDLWGTELYDLPNEIGQLTRLRHLQLSFYRPDDGRGYAHLPSELVSRGILSELQALQALSIIVHPEDQRWIKIARDIIQDVGRLKMLSYLQFYFPTVEALESFIKMSPSWKERRLRKFKFVLGHNIKRIISRVPDEVESKYELQDQCLRFVNGNEVPEVVKTVLKPVTAFYLDHHSEIQSLSEFCISNFKELKFCVVRECPNIQVMIMDEQRSESAFPNLEHLGLHYLWELEQIWEDPVPPGSFRALKYLMVDTCPKLEYIVTQSMLQCLSNLETFIVEDCESVKAIVKENDMVKYDAALLPQLTQLVLRHLPQLVTLGCGLCPSEEKISIHCCPKLILNPQLGRIKRRKLLGSSCNCNICI